MLRLAQHLPCVNVLMLSACLFVQIPAYAAPVAGAPLFPRMPLRRFPAPRNRSKGRGSPGLQLPRSPTSSSDRISLCKRNRNASAWPSFLIMPLRARQGIKSHSRLLPCFCIPIPSTHSNLRAQASLASLKRGNNNEAPTGPQPRWQPMHQGGVPEGAGQQLEAQPEWTRVLLHQPLWHRQEGQGRGRPQADCHHPVL
jgi:hypothetical protein